MTWNYRVCKKVYGDEVGLDIREVYYNEDGNISSYTENAVTMYGETIEELCAVHAKFATAFEKDIIDLDALKF